MEEQVITDIALLVKGRNLAMFSLAIVGERGVVIRSDPRKEVPDGRVFQSSFKAISAFENAVNKSRDKGWRLVHKGAPNWG